jgi:hypothetical protein
MARKKKKQPKPKVADNEKPIAPGSTVYRVLERIAREVAARLQRQVDLRPISEADTGSQPRRRGP